MNLRRIFSSLTACLTLMLAMAQAGYVYVLPPGGQAGNLMLFSDQLLAGGHVAVPAGAFQTLTAPAGDKAVIISSNSSAAVSFVNIVGGQFTGAVRTVNLDSLGAKRAIVSADGSRLLVLAGSTPGRLYILDMASETVVSYSPVVIESTPSDIVSSHDGKYAFVLSTGPGRMTVVNLATGGIPAKYDLGGLFNNISISPTGSVYVTGQYSLTEYTSQPPFVKKGFTQLGNSPGKLSFSPDGRYALAPNQLATSTSLIVFDSQTPGSNSQHEPVSMAMVNAIPVSIDGGIKVPDEIFLRNGTQAYLYFAANGRLFTAPFPQGAPAETSIPGVGVQLGMTGMALSDEFPAPKLHFYTTSAGYLFRSDQAQTGSPAQSLAQAGSLYFGGAASKSSASSLTMYNSGQTVKAREAALPYAVRVTDSGGRPVFGATVTFTALTEGVVLSTTQEVTSLDGLALVTVTAPDLSGPFVVEAKVEGRAVQFSSTATGGATGGGGTETEGAQMIKVSGDGQLTQASNAFTQPLVVRLLDANGEPIIGRPVSWSAQEGVALIGGLTPTVISDANGEASVMWLLVAPPGAGQGYGTYSITATTAELGSVTFTAVVYPWGGTVDQAPTVQLRAPSQENPNITVKMGTKAAGAVQVLVVTSGSQSVSPGLPIPSVGITVSSANTDPTLGPIAKCEGGTVPTDNTGLASCTLVVSGKVGTTNLYIDVGGGFRTFGKEVYPILLTVTPGDPAVPVIIQGNNQSGKPGEVLPLALVIEVSDGFGNMMSGLPVTWNVQTAGSMTLSNTSAVTGANGRASTRVQLGATAGVFNLKATVDGKEVTFRVTVAAQVAGFSKVSGDNQSGVVTGQPFAAPLVVGVTDTMGLPVAGVTVSFTVPSGQAALSANTVVTGSNGQASVNVTAGVAPGNITINASIPNFPAQVFNLTSRLPGPAVTATSFRNYSTNEAGIAPGLLVKISGQGLTTGITGEYWANMLRARLPETLYGFKVEFVWPGGRSFAPVMAVSNSGTSEWALVQVPFEVTGPTASAIVSVGEGSTTVQNIPVSPLMPGIIEDNFDGGRRAAIIVRSDGLIVTPTTPARKGEVVRMYVIGMGQTTPIASTNRVGDPDQVIALPVQVGLQGGISATVVEAKMAENLVGIYEILFEIPQDAPTGTDLAIACSVVVAPTTAVWSNESKISIQ